MDAQYNRAKVVRTLFISGLWLAILWGLGFIVRMQNIDRDYDKWWMPVLIIGSIMVGSGFVVYLCVVCWSIYKGYYRGPDTRG